VADLSHHQLLDEVAQWASSQADIVGVALVGSYARGTAIPQGQGPAAASDIDLVLLTGRPGRYLEDTGWTGRFGQVQRLQVEDWGLVTSLRVWYADGREVEFGITTPAWATPPIDEGTRQVIAGGMRILLDRDGLLEVAWACR
jgi:predicted nucleotidyltransferase